MAAKRLVLIGAGMTGRGQIAQLAYEDGWDLTLVDKDHALVAALRGAGSYKVRLLAEETRDVTIGGFKVLHIDDAPGLAAAVADADLIVTSVLEPNLPDVGNALAGPLANRIAATGCQPLNVIAAENMNSSSTVLARHVRGHLSAAQATRLDQVVGFPNSMVARVVPVASDPLFITAEAFSEWTADRLAVIGEPPALNGLEWVDNQTARLQRKLYIHNTGHAVCGYFGWLAGHRYIHEAAQDPAVMARITEAIAESGEAISREHGFERPSVRAYEDNLKGRLVISALPDDIRRVIRQPIRKLGKEERFVGPLMLCEEHGLPMPALCAGIAAVLRSRMPGDDQFERMAEAVDRLGPIAALRDLVDYDPGPAAARAIEQAFRALA